MKKSIVIFAPIIFKNGVEIIVVLKDTDVKIAQNPQQIKDLIFH